MGLFDALNGTIYHFNNLNEPVFNLYLKNLDNLDNENDEYLLMNVYSDFTVPLILYLLNPDEGIFKNRIKSLTTESLKNIYITIQIYGLFLFIVVAEGFSDEKMPKTQLKKSTIKLLEIDEETFNKKYQDSKKTWDNICEILGVESNRDDKFEKYQDKSTEFIKKTMENMIK